MTENEWGPNQDPYGDDNHVQKRDRICREKVPDDRHRILEQTSLGGTQKNYRPTLQILMQRSH